MRTRYACSQIWLLSQLLHPLIWIVCVWGLHGGTIAFGAVMILLLAGFIYTVPLFLFCLFVLKYIRLLEVDHSRKLFLWLVGLALGLMLMDGFISLLFFHGMDIFYMMLCAGFPGFAAGVIATLIKYRQFIEAVQNEVNDEDDHSL
jgi:hypothetical protein